MSGTVPPSRSGRSAARYPGAQAMRWIDHGAEGGFGRRALPVALPRREASSTAWFTLTVIRIVSCRAGVAWTRKDISTRSRDGIAPTAMAAGSMKGPGPSNIMSPMSSSYSRSCYLLSGARRGMARAVAFWAKDAASWLARVCLCARRLAFFFALMDLAPMLALRLVGSGGVRKANHAGSCNSAGLGLGGAGSSLLTKDSTPVRPAGIYSAGGARFRSRSKRSGHAARCAVDPALYCRG